MLELYVRLYARIVVALEDDRGDVPGWVLITIMTAGLVTALYALAKPQLSNLLTRALNSVTVN